MIRPFTCICLLMAAGAGLYTYQAKHQAELLDRQIAQVLKQADTARQRSGVLRAEFQLLNDPQRLAQLAGTHLPDLRSTEPGQFTTLAELDRRLPPPGAPSTPVAPVTEPTEISPPFVPMIGVPLANLAPQTPVPASAPTATPVAVSLTAPGASAVAPEQAPAVTPAMTKDPTPVVTKDPVAPAPRPQTARVAQAPAVHRAKPPAPRVASAHPPRADTFVTPVAAPSEALTHLAQNGASGVGRSSLGGTGGATFSSLGMARTGVISYPPAVSTR